MWEFPDSNRNGFGVIWWTDKLIILVYLWFSLTESGINIHAAIFTMLLMAICDCTDEAKTNPTHLNVVTVLCCSSPRWFVHIFLYYHNPGTAFGFCPAVSNSTYFPQLV